MEMKVGVMLGGDPSTIGQHMERLLGFEIELAKIQTDSNWETIALSEFQNTVPIVNQMNIANLKFTSQNQYLSPQISWTNYFNHAFDKLNKTIDPGNTIIINKAPKYFEQLNELIVKSKKE